MKPNSNSKSAINSIFNQSKRPSETRMGYRHELEIQILNTYMDEIDNVIIIAQILVKKKPL